MCNEKIDNTTLLLKCKGYRSYCAIVTFTRPLDEANCVEINFPVVN